MKPYEALIFKGNHVTKSNLRDGSPYKHRTFLMLTKDTKEVVVCHSRLVQSETQPDQWHTHARTFLGKSYWSQVTGMRMEHYIESTNFVREKLLELSDKVREYEKIPEEANL